MDQEEILVLLLDGKTFAEDAMVLALGITTQGEKRLLGFVQTGTENEKICAAFLRGRVERGLRADPGLLGVIDGATGLRQALPIGFGPPAVVQRGQGPKWENVVGYLPQGAASGVAPEAPSGLQTAERPRGERSPEPHH